MYMYIYIHMCIYIYIYIYIYTHTYVSYNKWCRSGRYPRTNLHGDVTMSTNYTCRTPLEFQRKTTLPEGLLL